MAPAVTMQCMEVWGGNQAADNAVSMPGLDVWVHSRPYGRHDAGGDVHYVSSCATGSITRLLVADVSGHGRTVADVATSLRALMRRYVNFVDQSRLVRSLNTEFAALAQAGGFATAVVATYFAPRRSLVLSNAGHPRPLVYRARTRAWQPLDFAARTRGLANIPLGVAEPTAYDQVAFDLGRDDLVLLYTDALIEARTDEKRQLGEEGLIDLLGRLDPADPAQLAPRLLASVEYAAGKPVGDDATLMVFRPNDLRPRPGLRVALRGAADVLRGWLGR